MGNVLKQMFGNVAGDKECAAFWENFPKELPRASLPYLLLDGVGITCSKSQWKTAVNLGLNVGTLIGTYALNRNVEFFKDIGNVMPRIFTSDPATNLTIFEYLVGNAIAFVFGATDVDHFYNAKDPGTAVLNCITSPIQCIGDVFDIIGSSIPATCPQGKILWAGSCYAPTHQGCKRTAVWTEDCGPFGGSPTNCADKRIVDAEYGDFLDFLGTDAVYFKSTAKGLCTYQKGGLRTVKVDYHVADVCPKGYKPTGLGTCLIDAGGGGNTPAPFDWKTVAWVGGGVGAALLVFYLV